MRRFIYTLCLVLTTSLYTMAQNQENKGDGRFSREDFRARTEAYITKQVGFTPEDAKEFFALYNEMKSKQWEIQKKIFKLKKDNPSNNATEKEYSAIILEIKRLNVEMAEVEESYYKRICKSVPASKVYAAMKMEDDFHRLMLSKFNNSKPPKRPMKK